MDKNELIEYIQNKASTSDLVKISDALDLELIGPDNINGLCFYLEDEYAINYIYVIDSTYNNDYHMYDIHRSIVISDNYISLYYNDIDPIDLCECDEIPEEKFADEFRKVIEKIKLAYDEGRINNESIEG